MTTLITGGTLSFTKASGTWTVAWFSGSSLPVSWHFIVTPTLASTDATFSSAFRAIMASNDNGGLWFDSRKVSLFNQSSGALIGASSALTWSAGAAIEITVRLASGTNASSIVVSGATSGNGTTNFTMSGTAFSNTTLGIGIYGGGGFNFGGTISDIDDGALTGALASTIAAPTLSAAGDFRVTGTASPTVPAVTSSAAGAVAIQGTGAPTVGDVTLQASSSLTGQLGATIDPVTLAAVGTNPRTGAAAISLDPIALAGVGTNPRTGAAAITIDPVTLSAVGGPALSVGVGAVAQQLFNGTPVSGTLSTSSVTTQSDGRSLYVMGVARGLVSRDDSAPFDSADGSSKPPTLVTKNFYNGYPNSNASVWYKVGAAGGSGTQFRAVYPEISPGYGGSDEVTVWGLELIGATQLDGYSWVERAVGSASITSATLTLTGDKPRILVGVVYGNAGTGQTHAFTFSDLTKQTSVCAEGDPSPVGYIQVSVGTALITTGGDKTFTVSGTSNEGGQMILMAFSGSGLLGGGSASVDAVTIAATAVMSRLGTGTPTVPAVTASGAGQVLIRGAAAASVPEFTGAGAGGVLVSGVGASSLPAFTLNAAGQVPVFGGASLSIDPVTLSATAIVPKVGTLAATIASPTISAAGLVEVHGTAGPSVPPFTLDALASSGRVATGAPVVEDIAAAGEGTVVGTTPVAPSSLAHCFLTDFAPAVTFPADPIAALVEPRISVWIATDQESP